jgi:hypothetical protein
MAVLWRCTANTVKDGGLTAGHAQSCRLHSLLSKRLMHSNPAAAKHLLHSAYNIVLDVSHRATDRLIAALQCSKQCLYKHAIQWWHPAWPC